MEGRRLLFEAYHFLRLSQIPGAIGGAILGYQTREKTVPNQTESLASFTGRSAFSTTVQTMIGAACGYFWFITGPAYLYTRSKSNEYYSHKITQI